MAKIEKIYAHKVLNSRGNWTLHTSVKLEDGSLGVTEVPEGASTGGYEAVSIAPEKAVQIINDKLSSELKGFDASKQQDLDQKMIDMDGTPDKKNFGANSILSVSIAAASASAVSKKIPLYQYIHELFGTKEMGIPTPVFNIINGGKHCRNNLSFQEFMAIPARRVDYLKSVESGALVYKTLKKILADNGFDTEVGDEGGFAPKGLTTKKALDMILEAIKKSGLKPGDEMFLGMDVASNSFYEDGKYKIPEEKLEMTPEKLEEYYDSTFPKYPVIYTEDVFNEDDFWSWARYCEKYHDSLLVVGDDLAVTNVARLKMAIDNKACNAVIVKPNQIGSISETYDFVKKAKEAGMFTIISHRSGESAVDTFISDFAVGVNADYLKAGAPSHERVAKYNRLIQIYGEINGMLGY